MVYQPSAPVLPMTKRLSSTLTLGALCLACSNDLTAPPPVGTEELCGIEGPVRLLPLDPGKTLAAKPLTSVTGEVLGDRYLLTLVLEPDSRREIWSVGRCGEDPILLAEGLETQDVVARYAPLPSVIFTCQQGLDKFIAHDPAGEHAAKAVFEAGGCVGLPNSRGLLTIPAPGASGPLLLQPWPEDPFAAAAEPIVVLDAVEAKGPAAFAALPDEVFVVTKADELVAIDLDDYGVTVLATGASQFDIGLSGRWIVWQGLDQPQGPIFMLDRESGESTQLGEGELGDSFTVTAVLEPLGLLHLRTDSGAEYLRLPSLATYALPAGAFPLLVIDEARALLGQLLVLDVATNELTPLGPTSFHSARYHGEGVELLSAEGGELVHWSYSGEARLMAKRASRGWRVAADQRVFSLSSVDANGRGALVSVDPDTLEERFLANGVHVSSLSLYEDDESGPLLSYAVIDADPERRGVWLAKPAP